MTDRERLLTDALLLACDLAEQSGAPTREVVTLRECAAGSHPVYGPPHDAPRRLHLDVEFPGLYAPPVAGTPGATSDGMTNDEIVRECVARGWGATDERKIMREFKLGREAACHVAQDCEDAYLEKFRASRRRS